MSQNKKSTINADENCSEPLYIQLYNHYKKAIVSGNLKAGSKLPSIRKCAAQLIISHTTVETAYFQLEAEGYIKSIPGSGFYVNELNYKSDYEKLSIQKNEYRDQKKILYDFASATVDINSFKFDTWRKYIKSALREEERLLSYGEYQGEYDLRVELCKYVSKHRGAICIPEQIVVGAGTQNLMQILCSLTNKRELVTFINGDFIQGRAVFEDRGIRTKVFYSHEFSCSSLEDSKIIYTSPSHINPCGDVMQMKERAELLSFAKAQDCLIIEDDYDSEFRYYGRSVPCLQGLDGGENVVYMGTFSKLLLPSIRISFMILPMKLLGDYYSRGKNYNQTASKMEQIALCKFIRDGHFQRQVNKARRLYTEKSIKLCQTIDKVFKDKGSSICGSGGFLVQLEVKSDLTCDELVDIAAGEGVLVKDFQSYDGKYPRLLLSCSGVSEDDFEKALVILKKSIFI